MVLCNRTLSVPVLLNCLGDFPVPLAFVGQDMLSEYFFKRRPAGVALALGYLRYIFMSFEPIRKSPTVWT